MFSRTIIVFPSFQPFFYLKKKYHFDGFYCCAVIFFVPVTLSTSSLSSHHQKTFNRNPIMTARMLFGFKSPELLASNPANVDTEEKAKPAITSERLAYLKKLVDEAMRERKIFSIRGGYNALRRALLKRNWIEKFVPQKSDKPVHISISTEDLISNLPTRKAWESQSAHLAKCERTIMSRLLQLHDVDFSWGSRMEQTDAGLRMNCHRMINRFRRSLFTSKEGLCLLLQQMHWHNETGVASVNFPRCYVLGFPDHYNLFVEDFRLTTCMALLKFTIQKHEAREEISSIEGTVELKVLQFAMDRLNEYLAAQKHLDIDVDIPRVEEGQWDDFIEESNKVLHENIKFFELKDQALPVMVAIGKGVLKTLKPYWPQMDLDGMKNIWIMKPGNKCRGRGIQLIKEVKDVAKIMELKIKYVVQKYIEKPLIIYNTKFDIRQWFLITSAQPLHVWMYRDSYLRFSSQTFSLENFHESLHLTNHAVQRKYKNHTARDPALPQDNMWDCHTFREYLKKIGEDSKWDTVVYPGMKECLVGVMLACQETMDRRPNTFEIYGADFVLAEDFKPWLLEINSTPDMSPTTSVTSRMCPQVFEDVVKVVIDRRQDPTCDTGLFELVYKQNLPRVPAYLGMSLSVRGRRMFKRHKAKRDKENEAKSSQSRTRLTAPERAPKLESQECMVRKHSRPMIADLMEELQRKLLDSGDGVQVASPVRVPRQKPEKSDARVAKVSSRRLRVNKNRSSNRRSNGEGSSCRTTRTAPITKRLDGEEAWVFSKEDARGIDDNWRKDTVSILKGKNLLDKFNKDSTLSAHSDLSCVNAARSILKQPLHFGPPRDKNLLTVGYRFGLPHLNRPNT